MLDHRFFYDVVRACQLLADSSKLHAVDISRAFESIARRVEAIDAPTPLHILSIGTILTRTLVHIFGAQALHAAPSWVPFLLAVKGDSTPAALGSRLRNLTVELTAAQLRLSDATDTLGREILAMRALRYIDASYTRVDLSLGNAARALGVSTGYLGKTVKKTCGASFLDHVHSRRLDLASSLLANTSRQVKDIAYSCGYRSTVQLDSHFRIRFGMSPMTYRQRMRDAGREIVRS